MKDIYGNKLCTSIYNNNDNKNFDINNRLEYFGVDSKCFKSSANNGIY